MDICIAEHASIRSEHVLQQIQRVSIALFARNTLLIVHTRYLQFTAALKPLLQQRAHPTSHSLPPKHFTVPFTLTSTLSSFPFQHSTYIDMPKTNGLVTTIVLLRRQYLSNSFNVSTLSEDEGLRTFQQDKKWL